MAEEISTTEGGSATNTGADESTTSNAETTSAEERNQGTGSGDNSQDTGSGSDDGSSSSSSTTQSDDSSDNDVDNELVKFAKSQGIDDFNELSDREKKLLKVARDNQKAFHEKSQQSSDELRKATQEVHNTQGDDDYDALEAKIAKLESNQRVNDFYSAHPDARELDSEMGKLVLEEKEKNGVDAARYLAGDMERLYILAKYRSGAGSSEEAAEAARREERERLRKRQEGSSSTGGASNQHASPSKVTREWVTNEYDPKNAEHRKMLDEAMARGDLY